MIAYGEQCMWWDEATNCHLVEEENGKRQIRCPFCGGLVSLTPTRETFLRICRRFEILGFDGHVELMTWSQGKCFKTRSAAWVAYRARPLVTLR